jgi:hypothetical protein
MFDWKNHSIDLINELKFKIADPGPLHAPVHKFKIRRDEKLDLLIETEAAIDAKSSAQNHPSGTIYISTEKVKIEHPFFVGEGRTHRCPDARRLTGRGQASRDRDGSRTDFSALSV